jgi:hypothetical protein
VSAANEPVVVWLAFDSDTAHSVGATRTAAIANLDDYMENFAGVQIIDDWHEPQLPEYQDETVFARWYQTKHLPGPRQQRVCRYEVREAPE